ncbi:MAG: hypothetical protein ACKO3V_03085, partial [Pirellula sp.]
MKQIGYYRGGIDVARGGVGPYADRLLRALGQHRFAGMQVTVIGGKEACQDVGFPTRITKPNGTIRKLMFHVSDSLYHLTHPRVG